MLVFRGKFGRVMPGGGKKGEKRKKQTPPSQDKRERTDSSSSSSSPSGFGSSPQSETDTVFGSPNPLAALSLEEGEKTITDDSLDDFFGTPEGHNTGSAGKQLSAMTTAKFQGGVDNGDVGDSLRNLTHSVNGMHESLKEIVAKLHQTSEKVDKVEADNKVTDKKAEFALKSAEEAKKMAATAQNLAEQNSRLQRKLEQQANSSCLMILNHGVPFKDINNWALREAEVEKVFGIIGVPTTGPFTLMGTEVIVITRKDESGASGRIQKSSMIKACFAGSNIYSYLNKKYQFRKSLFEYHKKRQPNEPKYVIGECLNKYEIRKNAFIGEVCQIWKKACPKSEVFRAYDFGLRVDKKYYSYNTIVSAKKEFHPKGKPPPKEFI